VQRPFGSPTSPTEALSRDAEDLAPSFRIVDRPSKTRLRLLSEDPELPDIELSMVKERRLFSRTWPLIVTSSIEANGPGARLILRLQKHRFGRAPSLDPGGASDEGWGTRFEEAGVTNGASTMTGIRSLEVTWQPEQHTWMLRLETLAGALIGTAPGSALVVGLEQDDRDGLFQILRAFRSAATRP
jgi:hypothetical protein